MVPGTPRMDLDWLDLFLRHVGRPRPLGWFHSGRFPDILLSRGSREAIEVASEADKLEPASAVGLKMAYLKIFFIFSRWRGELQEEADSYGNSEEARERQTEESW